MSELCGKLADERITGRDVPLISRSSVDQDNVSKPPISILKRTNSVNDDQISNTNNLPSTFSHSRLPLHLRLKRYAEARKRIFNSISEINEHPRALRFREFRTWRNRLQANPMVISSICQVANDVRPYAKVRIGNSNVLGLLDSGATRSCLGHRAEELINAAGLRVTPFVEPVLTASGSEQKVTGQVRVAVSFKDQVKLMTMLVVPSLTQELYLGCDFWKLFNIAPDVVSEITSPIIDEKITMDITHQLSLEESCRLDRVKRKFPSFALMGLGKTDIEEHVIDTGDAPPIKQRHYPVSPAVQKAMYAELDRMLEMGVIEESNSAWNSPVVLIRKPGKDRLCLDSRKVNEVTKKDAYPLPHISGLLSRLQDTKFISSIDLKDAFWQIPLEKTSREKTAFTVPGRPLYQFTVMPFGLCNAPQRMCRLMDKVIPGRIRESVFVYLDDLLVVSPDFDSHMALLEEVATLLRKAGLTINVEKSHFCVKEVKYLGFIVGDGTLKTDPGKISAIKEFPMPKTVKQLRRFLGMTGWYQRFIPNYASIAAPLTDCLKTPKQFVLTPDAETAFDALKDALCSAPVLTTPDFAKHFYIQCDASTSGVGGVLFQRSDDGGENPIAYFSKKLTPTQRNYSITELECYAALLSVKKFRAYVEGHPFTIITDHASLKWLMSQTDLSGRLARWSLKLQGFDFNIEHRKGSQNVVPDALSRMYLDEIGVDGNSLLELDLSSPYFNSKRYEELRSTIAENQEQLPDIMISDGFIYKRCSPCTGNPETDDLVWKLWIPEELTDHLISLAHAPARSAHGGVSKTLFKLRQMFYWPGMYTQVKKFVEQCHVCKESKEPTQASRPPMGEKMKYNRPFQFLYVDFIGPYPRTKSGNSAIFVVLDAFSRFVLLKPVRAETSDIIVKYLEDDVFCMFGVPEVIFSDNGKQFLSKKFQKLMETYGVRHVRTAKHAPHPNASERVNRSILAAIRAYLDDDHASWDVRLPKIAAALRSSVHQSIGVEPYRVLFGQPMAEHGSVYPLWEKMRTCLGDDVDVLPRSDKLNKLRENVNERLQEAHQRHTKTYNTRVRPVKYVPGQEIYRRVFTLSDMKRARNAKLDNRFAKARIVRAVGNSLYEVEDMSGKHIGVFHAKDLRQ